MNIIKKCNLPFKRNIQKLPGYGKAAYYEYYIISRNNNLPEKARELVRKVFVANNKNVSKTAKILGISRATIRRAIYGPLEDKSRKPKTCPKKFSSELENSISQEAKRTELENTDVFYFIYSENTGLK